MNEPEAPEVMTPGIQHDPPLPDTTSPHEFHSVEEFGQGRQCWYCPLAKDDPIHDHEDYRLWRTVVRRHGPFHHVLHVGGRSERFGEEGELIAVLQKRHDDGTWSVKPARIGKFTKGFATRNHAVEFALEVLNGPWGEIEPNHPQFSSDGRDWHDKRQSEDLYMRWLSIGIPHPLAPEADAEDSTSS